MSKELENLLEDLDSCEEVKTRYGLCYAYSPDIVEELKKAILELKAIKESDPNRTLKDLQEIYDYVDCVLRVCDIDAEAYRELVFAKSKIPFIKQYILEAQQQEKELETVRADLTIELNNKKNAIKMFKQERKLREKQEKVLGILKPDLRLVDNFLQARIHFYDEVWLVIKEVTDEEELELLKKTLGQTQI